MNPVRIYEYLTMARRRLFDWVRPLDAEQYLRTFPIGLGSLGRTLTHVMICEWAYVQRMQRRELPPYDQWPIQDEKPPPFATLEAVWTRQADETRAALVAVRNWAEEVEYRVMWAKPPVIVTASLSDIATQLAFHEVHHRAQAMNMLRQVGVSAEDLDFNALMYKRREIADEKPVP